MDYWTVLNPHHRSGNQKLELCDALVVCGDYVLVFQHKQINLSFDENPSKKWERWTRKAIDGALAQLKGSRKKLSEVNLEIYLDPACNQKLHLELPNVNNRKVFYIAVVGDNKNAAQQLFGQNSDTFIVLSDTTDQKLSSSINAIGHLPQHFDSIENIHIFEERGLNLLLDELDTITDFCDYLAKRKRFFIEFKSVIAASEAELLWLYFRSYGSEMGTAFAVGAKENAYDRVFLEEGSWSEFSNLEMWRQKKKDDVTSYLWDRLLARFTTNYLNNRGKHFRPSGKEKNEGGFRFMAIESRLSRRDLSVRLFDAFEKCPENSIFKTVIFPSDQVGSSNVTYIFLQVPFIHIDSYDRYRHLRSQLLLEHMLAAKIRLPVGSNIVGVAFEPPKHNNSGRTSEDMFMVDEDYWTVENLAEARRSSEETGYFKNSKLQTTKNSYTGKS
jgi:hypothetical protein